jgi:Cu+-exporting ATPase
VNLVAGKARVVADERPGLSEEIIASIKNAGYSAEVLSGGFEPALTDPGVKPLRTLLFASIILSSPLMASMLFMLAGAHVRLLESPYFQIVPATFVQFAVGSRFYKNAYYGLKSLAPGMDLLVALGTSAAYGLSVYNAFFGGGGHHELYFESSAVIITLVLLGKYLEAKAKGRASAAIRGLMELRPENAVVVRGGDEIRVRVNKIVRGDTVIVGPGERVPVDGTVLTGYAAVDESMITGESMPVDKTAGDRLIGGTVNLSGAITMTAADVGEAGYLSRMVRIVEEAQTTRPPIQRLADQIAGVFVPAVLFISASVFIIRMLTGADIQTALISSVAVLVIACPCAMGLAAPAAVMVGSGRGAELGVLFKNGEALESAGQIKVIVFDKTGTLTSGMPTVTDLVIFNASSRDDLLKYAGIAEKRSEHPVAKSVVEYIRGISGEPLNPDDFTSYPGRGVSAVFRGIKIHAGRDDFAAGANKLSAEERDKLRILESQGKTLVVVSVDDKPAGAIAVSDVIKTGAVESLKRLDNMGFDLYMITGDNFRAASHIAGQIGIKNVIAGVLPDEKAARVRGLAVIGPVAMIGDGINDAPALASASIGMAMGGGTDLAMEAAGVALVRGQLGDVEKAIRLSRAVVRKIRQNFFWAFIYNIIGIPLAAMGYLSPIIAAVAMAMSSVSVVSNSLLLKRFK